MQQTSNFQVALKNFSSMSYRLPPLNALRAFEAAARLLSFKQAAEELCVTPTAISHQVRMLEEYLGQPLFLRLTRSLELTPAGDAMLPKVREGLECFAIAVEASRQPQAGERLIIVSPPSFATRWLVPRLSGFGDKAIQARLHLVSSLQAIDEAQHHAARVFDQVDLREGDSPLAICFGSGDYPGLRAERLFSSDYVAVCNPHLLHGEHPLRTPADVRFHTLIHDDTIADATARPSWEEWLRIADVSGIDAEAGPHFRDSGLALIAAIDGLGITLASRPLALAEIAAGRLVAPFAVTLQPRFAYYLVMPEAIAGRPAVEAFRAWLLAEARLMNDAAAPFSPGCSSPAGGS